MERTVEQTVKELIAKGLTLAAAESCTGGKLSDLIVSVPGASAAFKEGFITYSNEAKMRSLGVRKETIDSHGAISAETAEEMARGAAGAAETDIALSITGNAGPTADEGKPVGLVYIGCAIGAGCEVRRYMFSGDRAAVRTAAAYEAMNFLAECLDKSLDRSDL